jgi:predicted nucleotidyltransferase
MEIAAAYVAYLDRELEGIDLVSVVEFGSHAKDEALPDSDHDLCVVVHSPSAAHVSACYPRDGIFDDFVRRWPDIEVIGGDLRDDLNQIWSRAHGGSRDTWISGPVVDLRWLIHRLAVAGDPDLFERMTAGLAWHDPAEIHRELTRGLQREAGFDPTLVMRNLSSAARSSLDALGEVDTEHNVPWIHSAVAALRSAAARFYLAVTGGAGWRRGKVMALVAREIPSVLPLVQRLYESKCTEVGRARLRERYASDRKELLREFDRDTVALREGVETLLRCGADWPLADEAGRENLAHLEGLLPHR